MAAVERRVLRAAVAAPSELVQVALLEARADPAGVAQGAVLVAAADEQHAPDLAALAGQPAADHELLARLFFTLIQALLRRPGS